MTNGLMDHGGNNIAIVAPNNSVSAKTQHEKKPVNLPSCFRKRDHDLLSGDSKEKHQQQHTTLLGGQSRSLAEEFSSVMLALEEVETSLRLKHHPSLIERAPPLEVDDLKDKFLLDAEKNANNLQLTNGIHNLNENNSNNHASESSRQSSTNNYPALSNDRTLVSFRKRMLKKVFRIDPCNFGVGLQNMDITRLLTLDVSHNELTELPGLGALTHLQTLNLNRNWFNTLPSEIGTLSRLKIISAARNFLKPTQQSLRWGMLTQNCPNLVELDLRYNQKCCKGIHRDRIAEGLLPLKPFVAMTVWQDETAAVNGNKNSNSGGMNKYVGSSAAHRNPILLRSQLEPLGTQALRKRLVCDFGRPPTDPATVDRAQVMKDLLAAYLQEGLAKSNSNVKVINNGDDHDLEYDLLLENRHVLQIYGSPVPEDKLQALRNELHKWTAHTGKLNKNRERPSIDASNYMILQKPKPTAINDDDDTAAASISPKKLSRRALRRAQKRERYRRLWEAGIAALETIDSVFAQQNCTEIAVTYGFTGSPHRDKQNCGPFYGLSLGNYDDADGKGGIVVEASARVLVRVNTKNRFGKVDGRFVHWVAPWGRNCTSTTSNAPPEREQPLPHQSKDEEEYRYSLIYYETGHTFRPPGPAVFSIPTSAGKIANT